MYAKMGSQPKGEKIRRKKTSMEFLLRDIYRQHKMKEMMESKSFSSEGDVF